MRARVQRGFTLLEMIVGVALSGLILVGAFSVATTQMKSYGAVRDATSMRTASQVTFRTLARDLRNVGAGNRFYVAVDRTAFGGSVVLVDPRDGSPRGLPTLMVANQIVTPGVMPGSDAIMVLRTTSASTRLADRVAASPSTTTPHPVDDITALEACLTGGGLVLLTDHGRATGESVAMLLPLNESASRASGGLVFRSAYGIDPMRSQRAQDGTVPPNGVGAGSIAECAELVTYWVDSQGNLREHVALDMNVAPLMAQGASTAVPIDPQTDPTIANGIEDLQVALLMSGAAPNPLADAWALTPGLPVPDPAIMAEARVARVSVLVRGAHTRRQDKGPARIDWLEDHDLPDVQTVGCNAPASCYDPTVARRVMVFHAEMRNLHLSDLLSDPALSYVDLRSHP